uniref:Twinkle protein, mitochondrial n=1 Tax=Cacopsylla melanoneura TaxID=428564 RepID=A0A8D8VVE4_9HEMI
MSLFSGLNFVSKTQSAALKHTSGLMNPPKGLPQTYCIRKYYQKLQNTSTVLYHRCFHDVSRISFQNIDPNTVRTTLLNQGLQFHDGYTCIATRCKSSDEFNIFVNKTTGFYTCSSCKTSGPWNQLESRLKMVCPQSSNELNKNNTKITDQWNSIVQSSQPLHAIPDKLQQEIFSSLNLGKPSKSVISKLNMVVNTVSKTLYIPLVNYADQIVGYKQICGTEESTFPSKQCAGLLHCSPYKKKTDSAVIVQRVVDFLSLCNSNLNYNIICLPNGLTCLPQEILPCLEDYHKLYLWFGKDHESTRVFSTKLNQKRCYLIRETDTQPLPAESKAKGLDLTKIIETASPVCHPAIITYDVLQQDVLADLQNHDQVQGVKWKRFPTLSRILGGHRRGELTILTGGTGSGKTTFMSECSLDLALQGVTTLWGSFEVQNKRLARIMLQQLVKTPLLDNMDKFEQYSDWFKKLPIYFLTFHGPQPLKLVMEAVEHAMYVYDTSHVIIDNVQFMLGLSDSALDRFYMQDIIIQEFRSFASRSHVHVTLVIHPRKENEGLTINSVFGSAKATQEADNVMIIQQKFNQNLELKKFLQIAKNRFTGDLGLLPLEFNKSSLSFEEKQAKGPHQPPSS